MSGARLDAIIHAVVAVIYIASVVTLAAIRVITGNEAIVALGFGLPTVSVLTGADAIAYRSRKQRH